MRALILIAGALVLAACSNNDQTDNTQNVDENLTAENIVSNDVTAIDAVTGDAANMAGESDVNDIGNADMENNAILSSPSKPAPKRPRAHTTTGPAKAKQTISGNTVANTAGNAAE